MIGFKTKFGLRKESGRIIALPLAKTSKGQPDVPRLIINPIVKHLLDLLYSVARARWLCPYSPTLESAGFCSVARACGLCPYSPTLEGAGFYTGSVFSGSV